MKHHEQLYFIAIIPPEPIRGVVQQMKNQISVDYNCKAALKSPPHITLHMPFRFPESKEADLIKHLDKIKSKPFNVELVGFGCFSSRVIYINVQKNDALVSHYFEIRKHMKQLNILNADYKGFGFSPHMTIAFRDLKKSIFPTAWKEFENREFSEQFENHSFWLLKHTGKHWNAHHQINTN